MLSIIIPFYNESKRLGSGKELKDAIDSISSTVGDSVEFILVNDGSVDNTAEILDAVKNSAMQAMQVIQTSRNISIEVISYLPNNGKGYAIKQGVAKSAGHKIVTMDADFSVDISELSDFVDALDTHDVVIGSKKHLLTRTRKKQKVPRRILGKGYTYITDVLFGLNFTDITCGFKGFKGGVAKKIFNKQKINRWAYDSETLFLAKKLGYSIKELPVSWYHVEDSRVSPVTDTLRSLKDLMLILYNYYSGQYN